MANKDLAVAFFTSDMFAETCGVAIVSLFESNKEFDTITVFIIEDHISTENKERFKHLARKYDRKINFISMPDTQTFFNDERFTIKSLGHTFGRMIVGQLLPQNLDKVLCMDSDMLVVDSLESLWNENLTDYYVAGVDSAPGIAMMRKTLDIEPGTLYCNGGLFLCNLKSIREDYVEQQYVEYIKDVFSRGKTLGAYEEEVINKVCYPKVLRLHPRYNLMTVNLVMSYDEFVAFRGVVNWYSKEEMAEAISNPAIIHAINTFYVRKRIWEKDSDSPYADEYCHYRNLTEWGRLPQIITKRSIKQKAMKQVWHILPKRITFKIASFVRNEIRPLLAVKRDDEYGSAQRGGGTES